MELIIKTKSLSYSYRNSPTIHNIDLKVPRGAIYGFLGPNGAGKSTTIRLLLGLLPSGDEEIELFTEPHNSFRNKHLKKIGNMIEDPSFYAHLTAYENLKILSKLRRIEFKRIGEVLEIVGLQNTGRKKVKQFSMGMKQRLGLAASLLPDPDLLILDEPTNGLDPQGIREVRELLIDLNKDHGKTIFLSSHILAEIELVATHIGIIQKGNLIFQGSKSELESQNKVRTIHLKTYPDQPIESINNKNLVARIDEVAVNEYRVFLSPEADKRSFSAFLKSSEVLCEEIYYESENLESRFLMLTKN